MDFWDLIAKHLSGEANVEESIALQKWLKASDANKAIFEQAKHIWATTGSLPSGFEHNTAKAWQQLKQRLATETYLPAPKVKPLPRFSTNINPRWRRYLAFAASVVLMLGAMFVVNLFLNTETIPHGTDLVLIEKTTGANETLQVFLPDSSVVWLNEKSYLNYVNNLAEQKVREVRMRGEAFFEVQHNPRQPFVVYAGDSKTEVLGTSFNIRAVPLEDITLTVKTGQVAFSKRTNEANKKEVILQKDEKATLGIASGYITKMPNDDLNVIAWQNNQLQFESTPLVKVVHTLKKHFNTSIRIENPLLNECRFTGNFDQSDLNEIIESISFSMNLSTTIDSARVIILNGEACEGVEGN